MPDHYRKNTFRKWERYKRYLRNIIESVDDDQTQSDKEDDSGWNDIRRNKKAHPWHHHEYSSG